MKEKKRLLALYSIGVILLVLIDQFSKWAVVKNLMPLESIPLWENVFHLTYCENRGAAFGILQNKFGLFYVITALVVIAVTWYMVKKRPASRLLAISLTLLVGGAIGNLIDRIFRGFVVDFFDFCLIGFPIFNPADCFVVCGAVLLAYYVIFIEGKKDPAKDSTTE